jgi:hypothetical protein
VMDLMKPGVQGEPDREIEDDADHGGGDAGQRPVQGLMISQPLAR